MKKKHFWLSLFIFVFIFVYLVFFYNGLTLFNKADEPPVEPLAGYNGEDSYLKLKYYPAPEVRLFDFSMDRKGNYIIFGSNTKKVTLIDGEGRIKWEKTFDDDPLQTRISPCGNYIGIGTSGGAILLLQKDREIIWEKNLKNPVTHLVLSSGGRKLISGSGNDEGFNHVTFFDQENYYEWSRETGGLIKLSLSPDEKQIYYTEKDTDFYNTVALNLEGEQIWTLEKSELKAVSGSGNLLAVHGEGSELVVYSNEKDEKWRKELGSESFRAYFNTRGNRLLVYDEYGKKDNNLYYFDSQGDLLWQNHIEKDALIAFSSDGNRIIYCPGEHQKDAFSKIIVLNEKGDVTRELEVTVRVKKIIASENADEIYLAGNDGSVYQVDLATAEDSK